MNDDEQGEPGAPYQIEGPDEQGFMWLCSPGAPVGKRQNLGPAAIVGSAMSRLGLLDHDDLFESSTAERSQS